MVQDDFGDRIRVGDGDEVSEVVHPLAPDAESVYDYLLADSLTLTYGGAGDEVRVYELQVRPRDTSVPGYVGSVFLDRKSAAVVRMSFTFTPSSYVDPYLDYIRISLDNALWMGRYWLPYRQEVELRREIPQLDFLAGSIIRGRFDIGPYDFNLDLPPTLFGGRSVTAAPEAERRSFPFERGLFDDLEQEGLAPTPSLEEVRAEARRIVAGKALSGLARVRFQIRSVSDVLRYDRAEGLFAGAGITLRPRTGLDLGVGAGWAFGRGRPSGWLQLATGPARVVPVFEAYWDRMGDLGPFEATAPLVSSLGAALTGRDWLDPWFTRGARFTLRGREPGEGPSASVRWERHASARAVLDGRDFAPVRPVVEGTLAALDARVPFPLPLGGDGAFEITAARLAHRSFGTLVLRNVWAADAPDRGWKLRADLSVGGATPRTPVQELFFLGGPRHPARVGLPQLRGAGLLARARGRYPPPPPAVGGNPRLRRPRSHHLRLRRPPRRLGGGARQRRPARLRRRRTLPRLGRDPAGLRPRARRGGPLGGDLLRGPPLPPLALTDATARGATRPGRRALPPPRPPAPLSGAGPQAASSMSSSSTPDREDSSTTSFTLTSAVGIEMPSRS